MSARSTQIIGGPEREHAWVDAPTNALLVKVVNPGGGGGGGDVNLVQYGGVAVGAGNAIHVQPGTGATFVVGDGGGSLTVDGTVNVGNFPATVAVTQSTSPWVVGGTVAVSGTVDVNVTNGALGVVNTFGFAFFQGQFQLIDGIIGTTPLRVSENGGTNSAADGGVMVAGQMIALPKHSGPVAVNPSLGSYLLRVDEAANLLVSGFIRGRADTAPRILEVLVEGETYGAGPFSGGINGISVAAVCVADPTTVTRATNDFGTLRLDTNQRLWTTVQNVTPGTGATQLGKAEDAVHASGDVGVMALAVRRDTNGLFSGANGDYEALQISNIGRLKTHAMLQSGNGETDYFVEVYRSQDGVSGRPYGLVPLLEVVDGGAAPPGGAGSFNHGYINSGDGGILVTVVNTVPVSVGSIVPGTGASFLAKAEDAAAASGDVGVMALAVRRDTLSSTTSANNDYATINVDSVGALWVREYGVTTVVLSGSTRGRPIQITGTNSAGAITLHTATTTSGQLDRVFIWLTNTSSSSVTVTIEFGTTGTANELKIIVPANETVLAVDGAVLGGAATDVIEAYASTASVVNAFGRVERLAA